MIPKSSQIVARRSTIITRASTGQNLNRQIVAGGSVSLVSGRGRGIDDLTFLSFLNNYAAYKRRTGCDDLRRFYDSFDNTLRRGKQS